MTDFEFNIDTSPIREWRSIITLIIFFLTNVVVLFPFHIPLYVPRCFTNAILDTLATLRITLPRPHHHHHGSGPTDVRSHRLAPFVRFGFPLNFVTMPLISALFLLAIGAIGSQEVHDGTIGTNSIFPIDIMVFFLTLAYIAISIDASGLIRYLAFKVLQKGGDVGHKLFFYLYAFFFGLGSFIGNDPIILSGTAFLAYMTRVSSNIEHPRAWIHTQFAVANIASTILVSSNPTNLVLAGAFNVRFVEYTANMIVPVVITAIVLFPFLLYIVFADESLIPLSITMHELSEEAQAKTPVNPNIPHARGNAAEEEKNLAGGDQGKLLSLEEIMNPFLDKSGAAFGGIIMAVTLITVLVLNATTSSGNKPLPVYWVTLPAAFIMLCWDVTFGWIHRHETREVAKKGRQEVEQARAEKAEKEARREASGTKAAGERTPSGDLSTEVELPCISGANGGDNAIPAANTDAEVSRPTDSTELKPWSSASGHLPSDDGDGYTLASNPRHGSSISTFSKDDQFQNSRQSTFAMSTLDEKHEHGRSDPSIAPQGLFSAAPSAEVDEKRTVSEQEMGLKRRTSCEPELEQPRERATLVSLIAEKYRWSQETFPTATAVLAHLPLALVPFALCMFVLVQALVTKGWVPVFAYGWDHWVNKTGTVGAVGGMGFLSVILCNFAGTNIGTTILLSRVIQAWVYIHESNNTPISDRTFWSAVYGMALGVNYGAFSIAFSASLAGLLWRDILGRKHIRVRSFEFARVNLPIIAIAMTVGCAVLIGEVYIMRHDDPTDFSKLNLT